MNASKQPRLFHLLHRTHQALFRASDKMLGDQLGISTSQSAVLLYLKHADKATMGDVAQAVGLTIASASGLVDRMEKKQLVARQRSETDRRSIQLVLTETGRQTLSKAEPLTKSANTALLDTIGSAHEAETFTRACNAIIEVSEKLFADPETDPSHLNHQNTKETLPERKLK